MAVAVAAGDGILPQVAPFVAETPSQAGVGVFEEAGSLPPRPHPHQLLAPVPFPDSLVADSGYSFLVQPW